MLFNRSAKRMARALATTGPYVSAARSFAVYRRPIEGLTRYVFGTGSYPTELEVNTPLGPQKLALHSPVDMKTVNEVFCRGDYRAGSDIRTVVDFGSNIGISATYFLTRNAHCRVHCFEPDARNVERLKRQLSRFGDRWSLTAAAVSDHDGEVTFAADPSGRFGRIDDGRDDWGRREGVERATLACVDADRVLTEIIAANGPVDILKIDIEGFEDVVLRRLSSRTLADIRLIYAETNALGLDLHGFSKRRTPSITAFRALSAA